MADTSSPGSVAPESLRRFCVLAHASALVGLILPLGQVIGPYVTWLLAPRDAPQARAQAVEAFNFQLNMAAVVIALLGFLLWQRASWGFMVLFVPNLYAFGMAIWAATRASRGESVRYPGVLRVFRPAGSLPAPEEESA